MKKYIKEKCNVEKREREQLLSVRRKACVGVSAAGSKYD
jgi:hypothetical protein